MMAKSTSVFPSFKMRALMRSKICFASFLECGANVIFISPIDFSLKALSGELYFEPLKSFMNVLPKDASNTLLYNCAMFLLLMMITWLLFTYKPFVEKLAEPVNTLIALLFFTWIKTFE